MLNFLNGRSIAVIIALLLIPLTSAEVQANKPSWAEGHILVMPKAGTSESDFNAVLLESGAIKVRKLEKLGIHVIKVPQHSEDATVEVLRRNPIIEFAEKDYEASFEETTADDTHYSDAWHLTRINAPAAWDYSLGDNIVVAVLDTGVDTSHPDLQGQILPGWNLYDDNSDTSDLQGHGTKVAGIIAALGNNNEGVTSIAWNTRILPVRISEPSGSAFASTVANGLIWAADNGADIANISYAHSGSFAVIAAANYMRSMGGIVCMAAGNDGNQLGTAAQPAILTVSATNLGDTLPGWSNYGDVIDLAAPGQNIWTTKKGGDYEAVSGTSAAAPVTAGVAALVMAANPALSPSEVENILIENSVDLGTPGQDIYFGHGLIDAAASVSAAIASLPPPEDTQEPIVSITNPTGGGVSGLTVVSIDASDEGGISYIELYAGTTLVGTDSSAPYDINWDTSARTNGQVNLTAYAYDQAGNQGVSQAITVDVNNQAPPESQEPSEKTTRKPASSGGGGGGGCTLNPTARGFDPVFMLMILAALGYLLGRRLPIGTSNRR